MLSEQATGTRFSDAGRGLPQQTGSTELTAKAAPPRHQQHSKLRGSTDGEVWLGHCAGTSVVRITGPQIPPEPTTGSVENSRGERQPPKRLLAERPEAEAAEAELRHCRDRSQLAEA